MGETAIFGECQETSAYFSGLFHYHLRFRKILSQMPFKKNLDYLMLCLTFKDAFSNSGKCYLKGIRSEYNVRSTWELVKNGLK